MLYDIAFAIFSIFYLPALIFKGKLHGDFAQRFARYDTDTRMRLAAASGTIWIQAVSVGEVALCKSLIPEIKKQFPSRTIVLSTITKTGQGLAKKLFSKDAIIIYFPLDFSFTARKAVSLIKPACYVMVETEIWPNVLTAVSCSGGRSVMINGRISDRSFGKYSLVKVFLKKTLKHISSFNMQSDLDARRIISLGAPAERVAVTGNMKFDVVAGSDEAAGKEMARDMEIGEHDKIIVAGSTHRGEEGAVLSVFAALNKNIPRLRLLIAPRHVERAGEIELIVKKYGFIPMRLSRIKHQRQTTSDQRIIYILDTIGGLSGAYNLATIVFIGGSLVRHGGQNPIEPAALGKAVIFGSHMFNFREIARSMIDGKGAVMVSDLTELLDIAEILLKDEDRRTVLGQRAREFIAKRRGATEANIKKIEKFVADV